MPRLNAPTHTHIYDVMEDDEEGSAGTSRPFGASTGTSRPRAIELGPSMAAISEASGRGAERHGAERAGAVRRKSRKAGATVAGQMIDCGLLQTVNVVVTNIHMLNSGVKHNICC